MRLQGLVLVLLALAWPVLAGEDCRRVVAVGDLHGGYEAYVAILREADVLDDLLKWKDDGTCLVQLGDIVDRGARSREILDLLMALQKQEPRKVHVLLGNHEAMNMIGDLRYTAEGEFRAFAGDESAAQRRRGFQAYLSLHETDDMDRDTALTRFDEEFPRGWFAHREAFSPHGRYGSWFLDQEVALILLDTLFVHGGIAPQDAKGGVDALNKRFRKQMREFDRARKYLVNAEELSPLVSYRESMRAVAEMLEKMSALSPGHQNMPRWRALRDYRESKQSDFVRTDGPLWNRDLAMADEEEYGPDLDSVLKTLSVERIVVAHTTQKLARIGSRFDDRVFLIDTGAGPAYGGVPSALEIRPDGRVTAIYLDRQETLVSDNREPRGKTVSTTQRPGRWAKPD